MNNEEVIAEGLVPVGLTLAGIGMLLTGEIGLGVTLLYAGVFFAGLWLGRYRGYKS